MQRAVWRVAADRLEQELDDVLPRLVDGVHERAIGDGGLIELVAYAVSGPLPHIDGARMEEVPDAWPERRRLHDRGVTIGGRVHLREPPDPSPKDPALIDVVVELSGAFGAGSHPTTRMCVELLLGVAHHDELLSGDRRHGVERRADQGPAALAPTLATLRYHAQLLAAAVDRSSASDGLRDTSSFICVNRPS